MSLSDQYKIALHIHAYKQNIYSNVNEMAYLSIITVRDSLLRQELNHTEYELVYVVLIDIMRT